MWGCMCAPAYRRKPGRSALSNLHMTNPNPDLPAILCSGIKALYIYKIASLIDKKFVAKISITYEELLLYKGTTIKEETRRYLYKVGSLLYAIVIIRLDIAFVVLRLARFTTNLSLEYQYTTDRVLNYLD